MHPRRRTRTDRRCAAPPPAARKDEADVKRRLLEAELRGIERGLISASRGPQR